MKKTLYLHIGHYKTGTTALQWFLNANEAYLAKNGLAYCKKLEKFNKHSRLAFSILKAVGVKSLMHGYKLDTPPKDFWDTLFDEVRASPYPAMIVSTEEFMRIGEYPKAARLLADQLARAGDIDIRVIVYLRSPQAHLTSWYNQLIKMGVSVPDYDTAIAKRVERIHIDYAQALKPWIDAVGADQVDVRPYLRGGADGTALLADFINATGGKWSGSGGLVLPEVDPNPRLSEELARLKRMMNAAGVPEDTANWTLGRASEYFHSDAIARSEQDGTAMAEIAQLSAQGIASLRGLIDDKMAAALQADLPVSAPPPGQDDMAWQLSGFLLSELHRLRQNAQLTKRDLTRRLDALEARIGKDI